MEQFSFDKKKDIEILNEEYVYKGFYKVKAFQLRHRLYSGDWSEIIKREIFERGAFAAALPYDPLQNKVILIEQFRIGAIQDKRPWLLEMVAGVAKPNEKPEDLILREMEEESGLIATRLYKMYDYWVSPGGTNEFATLYCAEVQAPPEEGVFGLKEENEDIYVHVLKTEEAFELLTEGKIINPTSIIALQWLMLNQEKINRLWK